MQSEIISKWIVNYKDWQLAITEDKRVFDMNTKTQLIDYRNNGCLSYRIPNTTKKIGRNTIRKHAVKAKKVIQHYIPF